MRVLPVLLVALVAGCHVLLPLGSGPSGRDASASDASADRAALPSDRSGGEAPVDSPVPDTGGGDLAVWDLSVPDSGGLQPDQGAPDGAGGSDAPGGSCPKSVDWLCSYASVADCKAQCVGNGHAFACTVGGSCSCNGTVVPGCTYTATSLCNECTKLASQCCP